MKIEIFKEQRKMPTKKSLLWLKNYKEIMAEGLLSSFEIIYNIKQCKFDGKGDEGLNVKKMLQSTGLKFTRVYFDNFNEIFIFKVLKII